MTCDCPRESRRVASCAVDRFRPASRQFL